MPLDAQTLGLLFAGGAGVLGSLLGNRAQQNSIQQAQATSNLGNQQAIDALTGMYNVGRGDLAPYRSVGTNALKQLEYLTYGKNLSDFSVPKSGDLTPYGTGLNLANPTAIGALPGSQGGAQGFQSASLQQYQNPAGNVLKGLAGAGVGAGIAAGLGSKAVGSALGLSGAIIPTSLIPIIGPLIAAGGAAVANLFGRHNDDKLRATDLTNSMSKLFWGDNWPTLSGGIGAQVLSGQISPDQAAQAANVIWNQYTAKLPTIADDWTTQNSIKDQSRYFSPFLTAQGWQQWLQQQGGVKKMAMGGRVQRNALSLVRGSDGVYQMPYDGSSDIVPAMLTPGEFVIRRPAVDRIRVPALQRINALGYRRGGMVPSRGYQTGGYVRTTGGSTNYFRSPDEQKALIDPDLTPGTSDPYLQARYNYEQQRQPGFEALGDPHSAAAQAYAANTTKGISLINQHQALPENLLPAGGMKPSAPYVAPITASGAPSNARTMTASGQILNPNGTPWSAPGPAGNAPATATMIPDLPGTTGSAQAAQWSLDHLPPGFDITKGSTDPNINHQIYGTDYFPGASAGPGQPNAGFGYFGLNNGWPRGTAMPLNSQQFAALSPELQGLYRTILAKYHQAGGSYAPTAADIGRFGTTGTAAPSAPAPSGGSGGVNLPPLPGDSAAGDSGTPPATTYGNYPPGYIPTVTQGPEGTDFTLSPLYQLQLREGEKNLNRYLLARGRSNSTFGLNALRSLSESLLANEAEKNYARVQALANLGYGAGVTSSGAAQNFGQQLANLIISNALNQGQLQLGSGALSGQLGANLGALPLNVLSLLPYLRGGSSLALPSPGVNYSPYMGSEGELIG